MAYFHFVWQSLSRCWGCLCCSGFRGHFRLSRHILVWGTRLLGPRSGRRRGGLIHFSLQRDQLVRIQVLVQQDGVWKVVFEGTTIGYKRLIRIEPELATKVKLKILEANHIPAIANFGLYQSSEREFKD